MHISLEGRTALITGGSKGLGYAMAERFARSGADVVILARGKDALDEAAASLAKATGRRVRGHVCDVSERGAIEAAWKEVEAEFGGVDILVNNAGGSIRFPIDQLTPELFCRDLELKILPAVTLVQLALPRMRQHRHGRILNVLSSSSKAPGAGSAPTTVTRSAGLTLTKVLSRELAADGILVNALCTGYIKSEQWVGFHRKDAPEMPYEDYLAHRARDIPLKRVGEAEEFANVACFLASDQASYVTGVAVNVDGGLCPVL